MKVALVSPYSWTYPGGVTRHIEALAGELVAGGHDIRVLRPVRRRYAAHRARAPRRAPAGAGGARVARAARRHDRLALQRRGVEPRGDSVRGDDAAARAARRRLRRRAPARARHARDRLGRADVHRRAAGRHVPLLLGERCRRTRSRCCSARGASSTGWPCGSRCPRRRRGRGGASTAAATASSPTACVLPEGGVPAPRERAAGRAAADRLRRPGRRAQGPADAAARVRGAARARARDADDRRRPSPRRSRRCWSTATGVAALGRVGDEEQARRARATPTCCARRRWAASRFGMVLTEAFAAGTPVVASAIAGYRDVVRDGRDGMLVPPRDATALAEALRDLALDPRARARSAPRPRAARSATPGRASPAGRRGLQRRARRARAGGRRGPRRGAPRRAPGRPRPPPARPPPAVARAGARRSHAVLRVRAARRPGAAAGGAAIGAWLALQRIGIGLDPRHARALAARVGAPGPGADVPLDGHARRRLARDPARRAARGAAALPRRVPGHDDRRADVGHAAGAPGRAVARADRGAPARAPARAPAGGARHRRLADAAQRLRARRARRRDVRHRRACSRVASRRCCGTPRRPSSCCSSCSSLPSCCARGCRRAPRASAGCSGRRAPRSRACAGA